METVVKTDGSKCQCNLDLTNEYQFSLEIMNKKMAHMKTEVTAAIKIGGNQGFSHSNTDDKPTRHSRQDSSRRFTCLTFFS
jgi:hypothetical protein